MTLLTIAEAAERAGVTPAALRSTMARERKRGVDLRAPRELWADGRSPRIDGNAFALWLAGRPGSGFWSGHPRRTRVAHSEQEQ